MIVLMGGGVVVAVAGAVVAVDKKMEMAVGGTEHKDAGERQQSHRTRCKQLGSSTRGLISPASLCSTREVSPDSPVAFLTPSSMALAPWLSRAKTPFTSPPACIEMMRRWSPWCTQPTGLSWQETTRQGRCKVRR